MNSLPNGWRLTTLGEVARWGSGGTPRAGDARYYPGTIPWAVIGDLDDGPVTETRSSITDAGLRESSAKITPKGAVLVAMYGSIGKLGIAQIPLATNQAIAFAVPRPDVISNKFLFLYLLSQRSELSRAGKGATQQNIGQGVLKSWPIPLPPLEEQGQIVDILEDHLSRLDAASQNLRESRRLLIALRRVGLDQITRRHGRERVPLSALVEGIESGKSFGSASRAATTDEWGIIKVSAMTWGEFRPEDNKVVSDEARIDKRHEIHTSDILVSRANTTEYVGAPVMVRETRGRLLLSDKSLRLIPREGVAPGYLLCVLSAPTARQQMSERATGTKDSMRNISQRSLLSVEVPMATSAGQAAVVAEANELDDAVARLDRSLTQAIDRGGALRRALLGVAFSGLFTATWSDQDQIEELAGV